MLLFPLSYFISVQTLLFFYWSLTLAAKVSFFLETQIPCNAGIVVFMTNRESKLHMPVFCVRVWNRVAIPSFLCNPGILSVSPTSPWWTGVTSIDG